MEKAIQKKKRSTRAATTKKAQGGESDQGAPYSTARTGQTIGLEEQSGGGVGAGVGVGATVDKAEGRAEWQDGASLQDHQKGCGTAAFPSRRQLMGASKQAVKGAAPPGASLPNGAGEGRGGGSHKRAAVPHGRMRDGSNGKERSQVDVDASAKEKNPDILRWSRRQSRPNGGAAVGCWLCFFSSFLGFELWRRTCWWWLSIV